MKYYFGMFLLTLLLAYPLYSSNVASPGGGGGTDLTGTQVDDTLTVGDGTDTVKAADATVLLPQDLNMTGATATVTLGSGSASLAGDATGDLTATFPGGEFIIDDGTDEPYQFWIDGSDYLNISPGNVEDEARVFITPNGTPSAASSIELKLDNKKGVTLRHTILTGSSNIPETRSSGNYYLYANATEFKMYSGTQITTNVGFVNTADDTHRFGRYTGGGLARWTEGHFGTVGLYVGEDTDETGNLYLGATGSLLTSDASGNVSLNPDGTNDAVTADADENVTVGGGALGAGGGTAGFAFLPSCDGLAAGTPSAAAAKTGFNAVCYDNTDGTNNGAICFYNTAATAWKCVSTS